ncbi:NAD(P)H-binding protein [Porphyrobacter sp. AAP60]|uniref:NAD(P)H-binding protein n=1 Tax=Porphyrobacter sp. AAP60 TaxID=1523423 RepID=UPI0006B9BDD1|nr:NAD(P)H-binding protein [Porphyrobacter sp. AAP60]KPF64779.1 nucleoside-diphosphate sugar epimerase [Porphyrobacter sp. AAP60]
MSDPRRTGPARVALVGATGLIGRRVIEISSAGDDVRIVGIARREAALPPGARMEMFVAEPDKWGEVLQAVRPRALICALGTTMKKAGGDEAAFRAVDHDLVLATAQAAKAAGVPNMVLVSAAGADALSKNFYMRVKGETEAALSKVGFKRLDILHPGLLRGTREGDLRLGERAALIAAPLVDPLLSGSWRRFRSIDGDVVAEAALGFALRRAGGRFTHDNDAMRRAAREWRRTGEMGEAA